MSRHTQAKHGDSIGLLEASVDLRAKGEFNAAHIHTS